LLEIEKAIGRIRDRKIAFHHYNSASNFDNLTPFLPLLKEINKLLGGSDKITITEEGTPQQENSYDCGVFVCALTELLINNCHKKFVFEMKGEITNAEGS